MKKIVVAMMLLVAFGFGSFAQSAKQKAEQLAAEFNKEKHKQKEKNGEVTKKDVKVEARPDIRQNVGEYAATYELEGMAQYLTLEQSSGGWKGVFSESKDGKTNATGSLKNIRIEDGLLQATLVDKDGKEKPFEAVFISRSSDGYETKGIGFKQELHLSNGLVLDKAFLRRQEL
jgi:hypothetical protein